MKISVFCYIFLFFSLIADASQSEHPLRKVLFLFVSREFRVLILNAACSVGHEHCLETAGRRLRKFLLEKSGGGSEQMLPADIRSIVYSFGKGKKLGKYFPFSVCVPFVIHNNDGVR